MAGLLQTSGLVTAKGHVAEVDCDAADFYRKAGAIPVTVSNVSEICLWWDSYNHIYGSTNNPYGNDGIAGGSSGGEASLIGSAGAVIGIGTDLAGSIRIPASFCGIYGHKPSRGIVSNWGTFPHCQMTPEKKDVRPVVTFVSTGPMCRYVEDLPLLLKVLSNYDKRIKLDKKVDFRKVKVYFMTEIPGLNNGARTDIKNAVTKAAKYFEDAYDVMATPLSITEMKHGLDIFSAKMKEVGATPVKTSLSYGKGSINVWWEIFKSIFRLSNHTFPLLLLSAIGLPEKDNKYYDTLEKCKKLQEKFEDIFQEDAIVLLPTYPETVPRNYLSFHKGNNFGYDCVFNILGFPSTSVPAGFSEGFPIGVQVVSGQFKDHITIAAAQELDKVFGGWKSPCPIEV
ncbi:fatty-acid amide hydrolase 2 [Nephila pilipes]|uniref:Fatty-acid amide hydrolase 2 n=1 Tax=Nephila pilipes TaxID=299642 RepID=A0A8X6PD52_NEPPI|nr:fatty-acid amide hydrolase 2 [Nephila pilipes]